jgi:hypothetical protein
VIASLLDLQFARTFELPGLKMKFAESLTIVLATVMLFVGPATAKKMTFTDGAKTYTIDDREIIEVTSEMIKNPGNAKCNYIYHETDTGQYIKGGCNTRYTGLNGHPGLGTYPDAKLFGRKTLRLIKSEQ